MTAKNNAARVAVKAKLSQKQADSIALPSWQQTMATALAFVQYSLEHLVRVRCKDDDWRDGDSDVDFAVDLALSNVQRLRASLPETRDEFDREWFMVAAAINLSVRAFSRPDCAYFRWLEAIQKQFEVLVAAVEFVDEEHRYGE